MRSILILCLFLSSLSADDLYINNPLNIYRDAMAENAVEKQSQKFNEALTLYLTQKPEHPSEIWHYNVGACMLALHEPGAAVYHFLAALRLDPSLTAARQGLLVARENCDLELDVYDFRPFWVVPSLPLSVLEISFLIAVLTTFCIASLGLFIRYSALVKVGMGLSILSLLIGLIVLLRFFEPLEGVIVYPVKLQSHITGGPLPRAMLPGELVRVLEIQESMIHIKTLEGNSGWLPEKNCWVLSLD